MSELAAAVNEVARLLESLQHPRHARRINPLIQKLKRVFVRRFASQQKDLIAQAEPWLRQLSRQYSETDSALKARLQSTVTAHLRVGAALTEQWPEKDYSAYESAVNAVSVAAVNRMGLDFSISLARDAGNQFAEHYLRERGFASLASDIDATTRTRIADAVAEAYAEGGSYDEAVAAIKSAFTEMKDSRAETIARTEIADAYNAAMLASAKEAGGMRKTWNAEGPNPCQLCLDNEAQGAIPLEEDFVSGADAPPEHPNCLCSVGFEAEK